MDDNDTKVIQKFNFASDEVKKIYYNGKNGYLIR